MKKFISLLTAAAMILTLSSCGNEPAGTTTTPEATTTPAETTTTTEAAAPEETEAPEETDAPQETEAPEETDAPIDPNDPMSVLRANAPIYANYIEDQTNLPIRIGFAYEQDLYGTGIASKIAMDTIIKSPEEMAVITAMDGTEERFVITKERYYMVSTAEKTAIYQDLDDAMRTQLSESMTAGLSGTVMFDAVNATYETGTEEYNGTEYLFEKISAPDMEVTVYGDPATKEIRYLISAGVTLQITAFTHDVDNSIFEIPSDYTVVNMADAMGGSMDSVQ